MKLSYNDARHAYWLDGTRCKSITACAKIPDDTYNLDQWKVRQTAVGLAKAPHLVESVAAHHTDKNKLNELCEEALRIAGAGEAAERGTTAHRVTERVDRGEVVIATKTASAIAVKWTTVLQQFGFEVVTDMVERVVVYPDHFICGKFDRVLRRKADGRLFMGDIKTGTGAVRYPHAVAIQLAMYANAPVLAKPWDGLDGDTEEFESLPVDLDREKGLVISLTTTKEPAVYEVDIEAGWRAAQSIVFPTLKWRKEPNLIRQLPLKKVASASA